ncbi:MAG: response regulator [bacterium]|nr:response regulator [bacterium]
MDIPVSPFPWKSWWFQLLVVLFILLLAWLGYLLKMKRMRRQRWKLEQLVTERTQSLEKKTLELESKKAELEKIDNIVKSINSWLEPGEILTSILNEIAVLKGVDQAFALVYDKSLDAFTFKAASGYHGGPLGSARLSFREVEERYIKGAEEIYPDIFVVHDVEGRSGEVKVKALGLPKSMLALKIPGEEETGVAGYLIFDNMTNKEAFKKQDVDLLEKLQGHITSAFIKSKLLMELETERETAQSANSAKSMFLARMSHEIRTPMNSVIGFADILKNTPLNNEQQEFIGNITKSGEALLNLIDEILDFSKIEAGQLSVQCIDFDPEVVVAEVCRSMQPRVDNKPVEILCRIEDDVPAYVRSDPGRIRQVLINLMSNAVKFTHEGSIQLSLSIDEEKGNRLKLHAALKDTGIGISENQMDTIFEAFQQADGTITRKYGGTGLGLAISRQIALLLGGGLRVESQLGTGSVFHFTAWVEKSQKTSGKVANAVRDINIAAGRPPVENIKTEPIEAPDEPGEGGEQKVCILLAEDNALNRKLANYMLTKGGYRVDMVGNGKEAVAAYTANPKKYQLIFMDVNMPEMDGREATRVIRERGFTWIPIIAMTAHAMKDDRENCLKAGMNDYISKPIKRGVVFNMIEKWLL